MPALLLVLVALFAGAPAVAAVETHAPPSTSRMSALDRENDVVAPPAPAPSPGEAAMPVAFVGYGIGAGAALGVVAITLLSTFRFEAFLVASTIGAVVVAAMPAVALLAWGGGLPLLVTPAAGVGTAVGVVAGAALGIVGSFFLSQAALPRDSDCIGCSDAEVAAWLAPPVIGALLGGAAGLFTTMTIVSAVVPAPDHTGAE